MIIVQLENFPVYYYTIVVATIVPYLDAKMVIACFRQLKEAKQKFVALKKTHQQAEKQRLEDSKKSSNAESNGDIDMNEIQVRIHLFFS